MHQAGSLTGQPQVLNWQVLQVSQVTQHVCAQVFTQVPEQVLAQVASQVPRQLTQVPRQVSQHVEQVSSQVPRQLAQVAVSMQPGSQVSRWQVWQVPGMVAHRGPWQVWQVPPIQLTQVP